jgi:hypothetical protein
MALRILRFGLVSMAAVQLAQVSCGSDGDRQFVDGDSGVGGATGGTAGSSSGGGAGTSLGGDGGSSGDAGTACTTSAECDDGDPCNGSETCDGGYCLNGSPAADDTPCSPNFGDSGAGDGGTAAYACMAGVCSLKCETDADCEDNDVCTGAEICHPTTKTCLSGTPLACEDDNPCTTNECDPLSGCFYPVIDGDGDGHADQALGSCGDDCDDKDPTVYAGAAELCDGKDNNCNGQIDELAPTWYVDCDGDGFAPAGAAGVQQCQKPASVDPSCGATGSWTTVVPAAGTTDCWDKDAKAHPMTATENNSAWQSVPMSGGAPVSIDYDYNCDGTEEKRWTVTLVSSSSSCAKCGFSTGGTFGLDWPAAGGTGGTGGIAFVCCSGPTGWTGSTSPACGLSASFSECTSDVSGACVRLGKFQKQECR